MVFALFFAPPVLADAALAPCMGYFAYDSLPQPGAVAVPTDAVPTVLVTDGGCPATTTFKLDLYRIEAGSELLVGTQSSLLAGTGPILVPFEGWTVEAGLAADQSYILRVGPEDGSGELSEIAFSTGSGLLSALSGSPELAADNASASRSDGGTWWVNVGAGLFPVEDPNAMSMLVVPHPDAPDQLLDAQVVGREPELWTNVGWLQNDRPDEVCLTVRQLDGAQRLVGESAEDCLEPEISRAIGGGRCDTGAAAIGLLPTLLAAFGLARRRG